MIAVLAAGCRDGASPGSTTKGSAAEAAPSAPYVELSVDGAATTKVLVTAPVSLETLVPGALAFHVIEATSPDGRFLELATPATTYPGAELRLYPQRGRVTVGLYRPPVRGVSEAVAEIASQPIVELTEVARMDLWTHPPPRPASQTIQIEIAGRPPRELATDDLASLTEVHDKRARGWPLRDVLELASPHVRAASVTVIGESGQARVTAGQLAAQALLKQNQRGQLVFQLWEGTAARSQVQVRGVTRLVVEPAR